MQLIRVFSIVKKTELFQQHQWIPPTHLLFDLFNSRNHVREAYVLTIQVINYVVN